MFRFVEKEKEKIIARKFKKIIEKNLTIYSVMNLFTPINNAYIINKNY